LARATLRLPAPSTSSATLTIGDPDSGDTASFDVSGWTLVSGTLYSHSGTYGSVQLDTSTGILTYTLNNNNAATNALGVGASVTDPFTITHGRHAWGVGLANGDVFDHRHQ